MLEGLDKRKETRSVAAERLVRRSKSRIVALTIVA